MTRNITTYKTLDNLVQLDTIDHKVKDIAQLFLSAMNDWTTFNQTNIADFVRELKEYYGSPLTVEKIDSKEFDNSDELNDWRHTAGSSIAEMIEMSTQFCNEADFDKILSNILNHYSAN